jgi:hypothetical protein
MSGYTGGDYDGEHEHTDPLKDIQDMSDGTQAGNDVTEVFKVDLENAPNLIKNVEKVLEEDL